MFELSNYYRFDCCSLSSFGCFFNFLSMSPYLPTSWWKCRCWKCWKGNLILGAVMNFLLLFFVYLLVFYNIFLQVFSCWFILKHFFQTPFSLSPYAHISGSLQITSFLFFKILKIFLKVFVRIQITLLSPILEKRRGVIWSDTWFL